MEEQTEDQELAFEQEDWLSKVTTVADETGMAFVVYGPPGVGKTTLFAHAPSPLLVQVKDTSANFLKRQKQMAADVPIVNVPNWDGVIALGNQLIQKQHSHRTIVFDGASGLEEYCDETVVNTRYEGDLDRYLNSYGKGDIHSSNKFREFVSIVQQLREEKKLTVIVLAHADIKKFTPPDGAAYDEYRPQLAKNKFDQLNKYLDGTLFMRHLVTVQTAKAGDDKGKAVGSTATRVMVVDGKGGVHAKNRLGLKQDIILGTSSKEAWQKFAAALAATR